VKPGRPDDGDRTRARNIALVVGVGLILVRLGFAFLVPVGSAPDEPDHFVKAFGAARLDFGRREPVTTHPASDMVRLNDSLATWIDFDGHALNPTWTCNAFHPTIPATCVDLARSKVPKGEVRTVFGTFQPFLYVVLGLPSLLLRDPDRSLMGMRLVVVAWTSALTGFGLIVASRRFGNRGLLASLVGWTPMLLYSQATLGTSGIESAAAYAMLLTGLDILLGGERGTRGSRAVFLLAAVSLAVSRPMSVYILAVVLVLVVLVVGLEESWTRVRALSRWFTFSAVGLGAVGVVANLGWSVASPAIETGHDPGLAHIIARYVDTTLPQLWRMVIGVMEWLDTELPLVAIVLAWSALVAVLAWSSRERDRKGSFRLWFLILATLVFGFLADYTVFARVGGYVQGRHVLPLFQFWALIAIIPNGARWTGDLDGRRVTPLRVAAVVVAGVDLVAWWAIAQREAIGVGQGDNPFRAGAWSPVLGWALPVALVVVGTFVATGVPLVVGWLDGARTPRTPTSSSNETDAVLEGAAASGPASSG
jgi:hypothetical protein